jgi:hypothetical protein
MQFPDDLQAKEVFIHLFRATTTGEKFSPVELIKRLEFEKQDDVVLFKALSCFRNYCVVWSPNEWQVLPMVVHKYQSGYYIRYGI